ncbi:hypothetical protein PCASD_10554 [Puccinia coronata f. sp. avenae]|uniref:Uncharacterized protein n=1 Tax=Puccinia coronata f. sp. avenae TaxID=200324 RepID=A0A2N5UKR2_9BASI|nr:hypothetical protein PCASD_10554 [Puccinia coronata f. sp. avenae]
MNRLYFTHGRSNTEQDPEEAGSNQWHNCIAKLANEMSAINPTLATSSQPPSASVLAGLHKFAPSLCIIPRSNAEYNIHDTTYTTCGHW